MTDPAPGTQALHERIAGLSSEERTLLERRLLAMGSASPKRLTIPRRDPDTPCLASFAQQRLWFLDQLEPRSAAYNTATAMRLAGPLDVGSLRRALDALVDRHESLRTTFAARDGQPMQVIAPCARVELPVIDLAGELAAAREAELQGRLDAEARRPFDLSRDLMLRALLVRLGAQEHVLLLTFHHIATDGWSMGVLRRELGLVYNAYATGTPVSLPPLPIQYADFALWQRQHLQGEILEAELTYWRQQLHRAPTALELPTDRPRPATQSTNGALHRGWVLPLSLSEALNVLGRRHRATLFMTLLAAVQVWLHRYSGQPDIIVGSPIAGRTLVETEGLIGFFVNNLVLRGDLSGDPSFSELLGRTREVALGAYAHQQVPFEKLVEELRPPRDLSRSPLFQVMLAFHNAPPPLALHNLAVTPVDVDAASAKFDMLLSLTETANGLAGRIEYNTELFDAATIGRMQGHLQTLIEGVVADPETPISRLPLLPEPERQRLHVEWNATAAPYPTGASLHQLVEEQAARTPDAVAAVFDGDSLTYGALDRRAATVACHLRRLGVGPGVLVGVAVERSLDMLVGLLGILKAGGAYVPLDPTHPRGRLRYILEDARVPVLVTQEALRDRLPEHDGSGPSILCLDRIETSQATPSGGAALGERGGSARTAPDALAYVIYTSGSTGRPKAVQVSHRAVVNFLWAMRERPGLAAADVLLAVTTLAFDIAGLELFLPLTVGARVVIASQAMAADGARLQRALAESGATVMQATPATWRLLLAAGWPGSPGLKALCGGEALPRDLANALVSRCGAVWNLYGPTETTIWSTVHPVEAGTGAVPIGRPIANTQVYVLDPHREPVPIGVAGELYIGGAGVACGYLNRPDLTAERFVPDPFASETGARLYRTGDRARFRPDGVLEFLGRDDHQVKLRGYRIELGEVEAVLAEHPAVRQVVVALREPSKATRGGDAGDPRLVAYVVAAARGPGVLAAIEPSLEALQAHARQKLPGYMVPTALVRLDVLPLTPNGKVDRDALPPPDSAPSGCGASFVAPRDALELRLAKIWEAVLHVRPVGVRDSFFDLGGHSLLAVRLLVEIERVMHQQLPLATLFRAPTVEQLARMLRDEGWAAASGALVPIQPGGSRPPLFCLHPHEGHVLPYRSLARHLGSEQPLYGIEARHEEILSTPGLGIETLAARYIRDIRTLKAEGPYFLIGWCFGGVLAFETARQLEAAGQRVAFLGLLETQQPHGLRQSRFARGFRRVRHRVSFEMSNIFALAGRDRLEYLAGRCKRLAGAASRRFARLLGRESALDGAIRGMQEQHLAAVRGYVPRVYSGTLHLFHPRNADPDLGWTGFAAGGIRVHDVPRVGHVDPNMFGESRVRVLADRLRACLDEAQTAVAAR